MNDLAGFLTARLDEDEAAAEAALPGPWHIDRHPAQGLRIIDGAGLVVTWTPGFYERGDTDAGHIARHDPRRVLREVEAKRKILARYERGTSGDLPEWKAGRELIEAGAAILLGVLRDFAAVYSDHPDYDPAWESMT